jgi:hypothetical protein
MQIGFVSSIGRRVFPELPDYERDNSAKRFDPLG